MRPGARGPPLLPADADDGDDHHGRRRAVEREARSFSGGARRPGAGLGREQRPRARHLREIEDLARRASRGRGRAALAWDGGRERGRRAEKGEGAAAERGEPGGRRRADELRFRLERDRRRGRGRRAHRWQGAAAERGEPGGRRRSQDLRLARRRRRRIERRAASGGGASVFPVTRGLAAGPLVDATAVMVVAALAAAVLASIGLAASGFGEAAELAPSSPRRRGRQPAFRATAMIAGRARRGGRSCGLIGARPVPPGCGARLGWRDDRRRRRSSVVVGRC